MFSFKQFIVEGGAKMSLKHIAGDANGNRGFTHEELKTLLHPRKIDFSSATEKTDGSAVEIGHHPVHGFYLKYSGSGDEYPNRPEAHLERALRRENEPRGAKVTPERKQFIGKLAEAHKALQENEPLRQMLKTQSEKTGEVASIKGEIFVKSLAHKSETQRGHLRWQGTSYRPDITGNVAGFVVHSQLPENKWLGNKIKTVGKKLSNENVKFDHDIIEHNVADLDVSDLKKRLDSDPTQFENIRSETAARIKDHWRKRAPPPKWGKETEGHVIHPSETNQNTPRFKLTSPQQENKMKKQMGVA